METSSQSVPAVLLYQDLALLTTKLKVFNLLPQPDFQGNKSMDFQDHTLICYLLKDKKKMYHLQMRSMATIKVMPLKCRSLLQKKIWSSKQNLFCLENKTNLYL